MRLYQVVGRKAPTANDENPSAYRMKIFAPNEVMAKSRFWYFMHQMRKMKKTTGEILDVNEVRQSSESVNVVGLPYVDSDLHSILHPCTYHSLPFSFSLTTYRSPRRTPPT